MSDQYRLFQTHIQFTHQLWTKILEKGDIAVDATCGNGHDTLLLAKLCIGESVGKVIAFDIQNQAIEKTSERIKQNLNTDERSLVKIYHDSNVNLFKRVEQKSAALIVYNLGYLPGGDKSKTTQTEDTMESVEKALPLVKSGGAISITCYPGHPEGAKERDALLKFTKALKSSSWSVTHHSWINRCKAPSLLLLQRSTIPEG